MTSRSRTVLVVGLSVVALSTYGVTAPLPAGADTSVTTLVTGLNAPRGITFDGNDNMYVAESGVAFPGAPGLSHTGRVTKYAAGTTSVSWQTSFESVHAAEDPTAPPDALGPEGLSALGHGCRHADGQQHGKGKAKGKVARSEACQVRLIMSLGHKVAAAESGGAIDSQQLGWLFRLNRATGAPTALANVGDQMFDFTDAHKDLFPDDFPDANPYAVLTYRDGKRIRTFVADAGANTINEVNKDGSLRVVSYIPNETAAPFRDATPTCIAAGPDGFLYVATLHIVDLFVNGPGGADVWRVDPDATWPTAPTLWATGLTTASACTFDEDDNFWATEMFFPNAGDAPPGDLVKIPFSDPTSLTHVAGGQLPLPGGIAQGRDGAFYVTTSSAGPPGTGGVARVTTN